jgi:Cu(I)/Ag(I) efflux system membrane fusion protein
VRISPAVVHNLGIRTAVVERGDLDRSIETIGKITRVEAKARRILTPPIKGELTYLAEKYQGDLVDEAELLFSVSSPELLELERQYRDATQNKDRKRASALVPKLRDRGLTPEQLALLYGGHEPTLPVEVYAQQDSFVFDRRGQVGAAVHTGYTVFNLAGKQRVIEVTAEIFEREWSWVKVGQDAIMTVRGRPGVPFAGKVVRVEPPVGYTTRSLEVALKFRTDDPALSQSMFAHVSIAGRPLHNVLVVPLDTVIRTGSGDRVVLVHGPGDYQPVPVVAGEEAGGMMQIRSGLKEGDKVVASGQFLIDSESNLRAGFLRMSSPGAEADTGSADHAEHSGHE